MRGPASGIYYPTLMGASNVDSVIDTSVTVLTTVKNASKRKAFVESGGKSPVFDRDEAYNRVADLRVIIGTDNMDHPSLVRYKQLEQDVKEGRVNNNESIWRVLFEVMYTIQV